MTTINDISDFARIIREQPEWADAIRSLLLGKELLELPERFAHFVQLTAENFRLVHQRLDGLGTQMDGLGTQMDGLGTRMDGLDTRMDGLDTRMDGLDTRMDGLDTRMDRLEGRFANFEGGEYERRVRTKFLFRARHLLGLERPYLALTQDGLVAPQLDSVIAHAIDTGSIDLEQIQDLHDSDLIIMGQNNRHTAVEISMTADSEDITRAKRRAEVLSAATGDTVTAAIVTASLPDTERDQAAANGVTAFIIPYP